jgi:putative heme iron utilization protein
MAALLKQKSGRTHKMRIPEIQKPKTFHVVPEYKEAVLHFGQPLQLWFNMILKGAFFILPVSH